MRLKVTVAYDGSSFHGWQTQRKGNSIQEALESVLSEIHKEAITIVGSGRTDARVHALAQVFHFDTKLEIEEERMQRAMNALLPLVIRVKCVERVTEDFHARFDCICKRYDYYVSQERNNPFVLNYMEVETFPLDISLMQKAAKIFLGTHDFTSFTSTRIDQRKNKIKTITKLDIIQEQSVVHFIFEGDGFLRYMVRMMVQTLIMVGKKKISVKDVQTMLVGKDKHLCNYKANPNGLYLVEVTYR